MKIRGLRRYRYKSSDKYRAETFRIVGLAFCTPLGVAVLNFLTTRHVEIVFNIYSVFKLVVILTLFTLGVIIMTCGLDVMVKFDEKEAL